jgi:uncharacterized protein (TIGR02145 family)
MNRVSIKLSIGVITIICIFFILLSCKKEDENNDTETNTPPIAAFTVSPTSGNIQTNFLFDASGASDNEDVTSVLQVRWDWDNDGVWDTDWSSDKNVNHKYSQEGNYNVSLEVRDTQGLSDATSNSVLVTISGCPGIVTFDYHGQTYNTVLIGDQCWMKENLNYNTGNSWCYDEDSTYCNTYGRLYDWTTIMNGEASSSAVPSGVQGICPDGWHIPSDEEWKILEGTVDTQYGVGDDEWDDEGWRGADVGKRLRTQTGWVQNTGTDAYGFSALPGGCRGSYGDFSMILSSAYFWSSTEHHYSFAWRRLLQFNFDEASRKSSWNGNGNSLRCVKD